MKAGTLFLASASPRRKALLAQMGYQFDVVVPDIEERLQADESASDYVSRLSREKAAAALQEIDIENAVVLGADTIVVTENQILEKPRDFDNAKQMLLSLSGRVHQVMTAVTVMNRRIFQTDLVTTHVWFKTLSNREIVQYWQSGEPCDKAGSYGIQGLGGKFVTRIEGSFYAVVGLPLFETDQLLHRFLFDQS
jgi:septum formation protein